MKIIHSSGNLKSDFKKVLKEWHNILKASVHIGRAKTIGVISVTTPKEIGMMITLLCRNRY
jgi:hypothetical protein